MLDDLLLVGESEVASEFYCGFFLLIVLLYLILFSFFLDSFFNLSENR